MSSVLLQRITTALAQFSSRSRLYELHLDGAGDDGLGAGGLLVEAFTAADTLQDTGARDIIVLSTNADIALSTLLGRQAALAVSLADGQRTTFSGDITSVAMLGSNGGFARYRLRLTPWLWRLRQVRNSRVWQDKTVVEICEAVMQPYGQVARWRWSDDTATLLASIPPRSYCCQYRESDYDFLRRLLTEEGIGWRFEEVEEAPGHQLVLFADSTRATACPEDATSEGGAGVRFHAARAGEAFDTIQALQARRRVTSSLATVLSYDYKAKRAVAGSAPARQSPVKLPPLESYDVPGQYAYADSALAQHYAVLQMEAHEARARAWHGRSTVRTLAAGRRLLVTQAPLAAAPDVFTVVRVVSVGVNNLPAPAREALAELFGPVPELLEEGLAAVHSSTEAPPDLALAIAQATATGYANAFDAIPADLPWRPVLPESDGRAHPKPTAAGAQSAIVIGADGGTQPTGTDELHCDALGRVRIRYHWQDADDAASCWVRVAQRLAGGGMGSQFLPRIGQEVLVQFIENDIDRPIVVGALYNGQGEGGVPPTPGGASAGADAASPFGGATDQATSGQGNLAGGNSPVWHGASAGPDGHRNPAAQWGIRTKEFGGAGYNQLLFDDTDAQGRVQLRSTHAGTELNLGHVVHAADNYRGSLRGQGAELRTDAWGAVRGGAGLLVTSYAIAHNAQARDPAGDNAAGIALMKQAVKLAETFSEAATTHRTVALAGHVGSTRAGGSVKSDDEAPLARMLSAVSGMVGASDLDAARADAGARSTAPDDGKVPHPVDQVIAVSARAGLAATAAQAMQLSSGDTVALMSGADSQFVGGAGLRVHAGQALGVLGGAVAPGAGGIGLQAIAAQGPVDVQAQGDTLSVQARDDVQVISASSFSEWAAHNRISLSTAGGANITIEGGNIVVQAPGKIAIHAGKKSFTGPEQASVALPVLPQSICVECLLKARAAGSPFAMR